MANLAYKLVCEHALQKITQGPYSQKNRKLVSDFDDYLRMQEIDYGARSHYYHFLRMFLDFTHGKDLSKATHKDVINFLDHRRETVEDYTVHLTYAKLRRFFEWLNKGKLPYEFTQIKVKKPRHSRVGAQEILTKEEVMNMVQAAGNPRDKAMLYCLWESGCRISEFLATKIGDLKIEDKIVSFKVDGKTGERNCFLIESIPSLLDWLNVHPDRNNKEAPLWINLEKTRGQHLRRDQAFRIITRAGLDAKITKPVFLHALRHSRATFLARVGKNEAFLRFYFGWSQNSNQPTNYVKLIQSDIKNQLLNDSGIGEEEKKEKMAAPLKCPRCRVLNDFNATYCKQCFLILDPEKAIDYEQTRAKDDKSVKEMLERITKMQQNMQEMFGQMTKMREEKTALKAKTK